MARGRPKGAAQFLRGLHMKLSETIREINNLHKAMLDFQEPQQHRQWTPQEPREISRNIMKINDLQQAYPANQRLRDGSPGSRKRTTDGTDKVAQFGLCVLFTVPLVPLINTLIIHHGNDFTRVRENQKTYRRLFGMIFFGGFGSMLVAPIQ
jgi:hypothetical protein